jgi:hypothetical protein
MLAERGKECSVVFPARRLMLWERGRRNAEGAESRKSRAVDLAREAAKRRARDGGNRTSEHLDEFQVRPMKSKSTGGRPTEV